MENSIRFVVRVKLNKARKMLTGLTRDAVVSMTRWHLKCEQEGTLHLYTRVVGSAGVVGGKL